MSALCSHGMPIETRHPFEPSKDDPDRCDFCPGKAECHGSATPAFTGSRDSLLARVSDVLRRSGVEDAEQLIRAMEVNAAEVRSILTEAKPHVDSNARYLGNNDARIIAFNLSLRIDRALSGREIGPPKPASERAE